MSTEDRQRGAPADAERPYRHPDHRAGAPEARSLVVDTGRDPAEVAARLGPWLAGRAPQRWSHLVDVRRVEGGGSSNETLTAGLVTVDGSTVPVVVRLVIPFQQVFLGSTVSRQAAAMAWVREHSTAPVPEILAVDPDGALLGAPFLVMTRSPGSAPLDFPSYAVEGFVADLDAPARHALWREGVATMAAVHATDVDGLALPGLPTAGGDVLGERVEHLLRYRRELDDLGPTDPFVDEALAELARSVPTDAPRGLSWGDARYGNMLFVDGPRCTAVLDWELVTLAGPLFDLAWWRMFDRVHAEDLAHARLDGLGDPDETAALWSELTGHPTTHLRWHDLAVHLLLAMIRQKAFAVRARRGLPVPAAGDPRSVDRLLRRARTLLA